MVFDNTQSDTSKEVKWFFGLQEGIRLSNVSVMLNGSVYWGRVIEESAAITTYEEEVEAGRTAVLVIREYGGYSLNFNVANGTTVALQVYAEGLLTRRMGLYSLTIPLVEEVGLECDFNVDMIISSQYADISGYSVSGLDSFDATDLISGVRFQYSANNVEIPTGITFCYALTRQEGGSQLLTYNNGTQNFFAYLLAPSITDPEEAFPREYIFILDKSGSMIGSKITQAKTAFCSMIDDLGSNDIFNVIAFSTEVTPLWNEPYGASNSNKDTAKNWVNDLEADGSTNFYGAGVTGLETFTDGSYTKAMLILSDGQPTCGESTESSAILSAFQVANTKGVSISTISFGTDADESLMANVASQHNGFFELIHPEEDAASKIIDFYKQWSLPIASGYTIYVDGAIDYSCLQSTGGAPFFNGTEVVITGRYNDALSISTTIEYSSGSETYTNTAGVGGFENAHIERMWAQHRISWLLFQVKLEGDTDELRGQIVALGIQYGLVIEGYTGMILTTFDASGDDGELATAGTYLDNYERYPEAPGTGGGAYDAFPAANMLLWPGIMIGLVVVGFVGVFIYLSGRVIRK